MARLLLATYLLTGLVGGGGFVLCVESDSSVSVESLLQECCEQQAASHALRPHSAEQPDAICPGECGCTDLTADSLLVHRLELDHPGRDIPTPLRCVFPPQCETQSFTAQSANRAAAVLARCRPELPGAGASPRILRT
jgi:hypothetical protein